MKFEFQRVTLTACWRLNSLFLNLQICDAFDTTCFNWLLHYLGPSFITNWRLWAKHLTCLGKQPSIELQTLVSSFLNTHHVYCCLFQNNYFFNLKPRMEKALTMFVALSLTTAVVLTWISKRTKAWSMFSFKTFAIHNKDRRFHFKNKCAGIHATSQHCQPFSTDVSCYFWPLLIFYKAVWWTDVFCGAFDIYCLQFPLDF